MDGFSVKRACELQPLAEKQRWLIQQLWSHQAVGIIGGEPKSCKSFLALGMAVAVASGSDCLGRFRVPQAGRVLLFAAEDALHIVRARLQGICAYHGVDLHTLELWVITQPVIRLDCERDRVRLERTVQQIAPSLLVLDPLVRLHRVDENQSAAIAPILASLRELQRKHHCAVALVHHARKGASLVRAGQALRGSSELHAWGDSNLYIRRHKQQLSLSVEHRACRCPDAFGLKLNCDGNAIALLADKAEPADECPAKSADHNQSGKQRVMAVLGRLNQPVRMRSLRDACQMRAESLVRLLHDLVDSGEVIRTDSGWILAHGSSQGDQ
jgi:hypothetical protein